MTSPKSKHKLGKIEVAFIIIIILAIAAVGWFAWRQNDKQAINSFADCVAAGNPVMESYPAQCAANGQTFVDSDQQDDQLLQPDTSPIPLAELPDGLQAVVRQARNQSCAADASASDEELDTNTTAVRGAFIDGMFAQVNLPCGDNESNGLFAYENNAWVFVAATQSKFLCNDLVSHSIPVTYIAECVETADAEPVANPVTI